MRTYLLTRVGSGKRAQAIAAISAIAGVVSVTAYPGTEDLLLIVGEAEDEKDFTRQVLAKMDVLRGIDAGKVQTHKGN